MAAGAFWFSVMSLLVKGAGARLPSLELVLARAVVTLVLSVVLLRRARLHPWGTHRRRLVLRGLFGFTGLVCFYYSLTHLPIAEATVLQYTNPIFTALLAAMLLGERLTWRESGAALISLAGVVLVARPAALFGGAAPLPTIPVLVALFGALVSAAAYVTVRSLGSSEHPLVVVFYFPLVSVPLAIPAVLPVWIRPTPLEWLALVGIGVATQIAQVYMTRGLQLEPAGRATAVGYLQVVFAAAWGMLLFHEALHPLTLLGTVLVVSGTLALALRRRPAGARTGVAASDTASGDSAPE